MSTLKNWLGTRRRDAELASLLFAGWLPIHVFWLAAMRLWGGTVGRDAVIYHGFEIRNARRLTLGARSSIGNGAILDARNGITIGSDVNFSTDVHIWTGQHDWQDPDFAYQGAPVVIGVHSWISTRVTILPGCTIGEGAVVAAGAVVTKDVAPYSLVGGVPAKEIGPRPRPMRYKLVTRRRKSWWW